MGLSDYECSKDGDGYEAVSLVCPDYIARETEWAISKVSRPSSSIQLTPKESSFKSGPDMIILVGAGIQYGMPGAGGNIQPAPFSGAARLLKGV
jgi:hypothetical protein